MAKVIVKGGKVEGTRENLNCSSASLCNNKITQQVNLKELILLNTLLPKMKINYHGRTFTGVSNSPNGQVSGETVFNYSQRNNILSANYQGGSIREGYMLGQIREDNSLYFAYHHIDNDGQLKSGYCNSKPEVLPDGRIRLHEQWEWTHGGEGKGESIVEEVYH